MKTVILFLSLFVLSALKAHSLEYRPEEAKDFAELLRREVHSALGTGLAFVDRERVVVRPSDEGASRGEESRSWFSALPRLGPEKLKKLRFYVYLKGSQRAHPITIDLSDYSALTVNGLSPLSVCRAKKDDDGVQRVIDLEKKSGKTRRCLSLRKSDMAKLKHGLIEDGQREVLAQKESSRPTVRELRSNVAIAGRRGVVEFSEEEVGLVVGVPKGKTR